MTTGPSELDALRAEVDRVDARLVELLIERARLAEALGRWKRARGIAPFDPAREEAVVARAAAAARAPLDRAALERVFRAILAESRRVVQEARGP